MAAVAFQSNRNAYLHLDGSSNNQLSALIALNCLLKKGAGVVTNNEINEFLTKQKGAPKPLNGLNALHN